MDHYPPTFRLWVGLGVLAMLVAIAGWSRASQLRKLVAVVTVPLTLAAAFVLINSHYAYWPTVGDLLGRRLPNEVSRQALTNILQGQPSPIGDHGSSSLSPSGPPIERSNGAAPTVIRANSPSAPPARRAGAAPRTAARATASAPTPPLLHGVLAPLDIPPGTSGFAHRQGTLYLPPGFSDLASERLVLQPGDFFSDPLPACDAYLLMEVIHDWGDEEATAILKAVREQGYETPTPIQAQAIPAVLEGHDILGGAQTGTGKTAAFSLPLLHKMLPHENASMSPARHPVRALVIRDKEFRALIERVPAIALKVLEAVAERLPTAEF